MDSFEQLTGHTIGTNSLLKVMAGDVLNATTDYYYPGSVTNNNNSLVTDIVAVLVNAISGSPVTPTSVHGNTGNISNDLNASAPFASITDPDKAATDNIPRAYLNVMFFNERFEFVEEGSTALRVSQPGDNAAPLVLNNLKAPKNGYAYIYVSNENDDAVYFDNFTVSDTRGRIIEEDHYYAFGLKIVGISSVKFGNVNEGSLKNNNLYNDKELFDDADLNWYDYGFRNYDAQIGRFTQLDPLTWDYPELTPYQYASCDPIMNVDIDGLEGETALTAATAKLLPEVNVIAVLRHAAPSVAKTGATTIAGVAIKVADVATDFMPLVSGVKDIYQGVRNGNWWQASLGILSIGADVFTLGGSSIAKGVIKTAVREGAEIIAKETVEQVVKKEITKGGTYVLKEGETIIRTGRTKNLAQREIQHRSGKETKDLTFEAVHHTDGHAAQRGLEHLLSKKFEKTASKANGGLNKIKAMSDKTLKSTKGQNYLKAAAEHLKKN